MFSTARNKAQGIAQQMVAGHCGLVAWWTLKHGGVIEAMERAEKEGGAGLVASEHAERGKLSLEVLDAMLDYLGAAGLVVAKKDGVHLTADGKALLEHEDGVLELVRAYEPVLQMAEHLLAKLKGYGGGAGTGGGAGGGTGGVMKKSDYLVESQALRYRAEVFPAIGDLIEKHKRLHVLDVACGTGELLVAAATRVKRMVGVGIGGDGIMVRKANKAIAAADLEPRLIAVGGNPVDVCVDTQRVFDRIGVSRQLWDEIDCVIAVNLFSDIAGRDEKSVGKVLEGIGRNFRKAYLILVEPVASERFGKNYYAAELELFLRLARAMPWEAEVWREAIGKARMRLVEEVGLVTDGLTAFVCKAAGGKV